MIQFFVSGIPATAGSKTPFIYRSKKDGKQRVAMCPANKKQKPWMAQVRAVAVENYKGAPITKPISMLLAFFLPRPKSHFGSGKNADKLKPSAPDYPTTRPDLTKLLRAVEDALKGVVWRDDNQVIFQKVVKDYCDATCPTPGVYVIIDEI